MPHLLANRFFKMVFEHIVNYFHPRDSTSGFLQLFQLCFHIAQGHIPAQITHILGTVHLLAMTKPSDGIRPIVAGETLYQFISHALCFQFHEIFATHFSPHQFGVVAKDGCETISMASCAP
jgi:hypothetical protein